MTILQRDLPAGLACPLCHHPFGTPADATLATGGDYRCETCGQQWTAARLETVAAYAEWVLERNAAAAAA